MLKTWITGTNNFVDQGLSPSEWINDDVTISNDGKLGKCLYFNGTSSRLSTTGYTLSNKWSWSCWVKEDASITDWQCVISLNNNGSDPDMQTALWLKANEHRYEVLNNTKYNSTIQYTQGQWNHYAMSFDGTTTKAYLNGNQVATFTSTPILSRTNLTIGARGTNTNGGHSSVSNRLKGYINDLRIWDNEVISPLQVKQISQGLVLHYPLNNNGWGQENLFKKTREVFDNNGSKLYSTTVNNGLIIDSNAPNGKYRSWNLMGENTADSGVYYTYTKSNIALEDLTANEIYTLSFWSRCSKTKNLKLYPLVESQTVQKVDGGDIPSSGNIVVDNKWQRHSVTFKWTSTSKITTCFYLRSLDENVTLDIASPKLEKGDKPTPWCPNSADELANKMGMNDGIEYDCSGFGNNGEKTTTINYSSNSARYMGSYEFNSTDRSNIYFPNEANPSEEISISLWGYKNNWNAAERLAGKAASSSGWCIGDYGSENTMFGFFLQSTSGGYNTISGFRQLSSGWHHFVITFDGYNLKYYLDGECISTKTWESKQKLQVGTGKYNIGSHTNNSYFFNGNMNDFRIYATALSAEDVLSLYQLGGSIDSNGVFHTYEYVEG